MNAEHTCNVLTAIFRVSLGRPLDLEVLIIGHLEQEFWWLDALLSSTAVCVFFSSTNWFVETIVLLAVLCQLWSQSLLAVSIISGTGNIYGLPSRILLTSVVHCQNRVVCTYAAFIMQSASGGSREFTGASESPRMINWVYLDTFQKKLTCIFPITSC